MIASINSIKEPALTMRVASTTITAGLTGINDVTNFNIVRYDRKSYTIAIKHVYHIINTRI